ncbi:MAG: HD domain-containing protein [Oscillospiraceae bacterium]
MILTDAVRRALRIAYNAHHGQLDRGGVPYIFHPYHLAEQMTTEDTVIAALLHDVAEDTPMTLELLAREGFSEAVLCALRLLTHDPAQDYMDYIAALAENPIARAVKIADLRHNSDPARLPEDNEAIRRRMEKYRRALELLGG